MFFTRLCFGQAAPGDLRIAESGPRDDGIIYRTRTGEEDIPNNLCRLKRCHMREKVVPNHIASSVDIFDSCLQLIVDLNPLSSHLNADLLQSQPFDIRLPSRRNQNPINDDFAFVSCICCLELDADTPPMLRCLAVPRPLYQD